MLLSTYNHNYTEVHFYIQYIYMCPCLSLRLFLSYLCHLFVLSLWSIFHFQPHLLVTSFRQTYLFFIHFLDLGDNVDGERKQLSNSKSWSSGCCLAFAWLYANFNPALLIKVLLIKKVRNRFIAKTCLTFSCTVLVEIWNAFEIFLPYLFFSKLWKG